MDSDVASSVNDGIKLDSDNIVSKEMINQTLVIPIAHSPIFPSMMAPIILSEDKFYRDFEKTIDERPYVCLNLVKDKRKIRANSNKSKEKEITFEISKRKVDKSEKINGTKEDKKNVAFLKEKKKILNELDESIGIEDVYRVGVLCKVIKKLKLPDGSVNILVHGLKRYEAVTLEMKKNLLFAKPKIQDDVLELDVELDAYTRTVINQVKKLSELNPYFNEEMKLAMLNSPSPGALADLVAFSLSLEVKEAQDFLETINVKKRFEKLLLYLKREQDVSDIQKKITDEVNDKVGKYQKEYFLREQLKVIRNELGMEEDEKSSDLRKLKDAVIKVAPPKEVKKLVLEEIEKLESIPESSPEYNMIRTYVGWITQLPWNNSTKDDIEIKRSRMILNRDHFGLEKPKQRILELLAVRKLRPQYDGTILCFSGPPGVGKTSLGKSIATALNRAFFRFSLGGMRDEAEIKGHRRTYIGAMPGKLIQALKRVEVNNPVIMLDEIDKLGESYQGDPGAALLEVLDPEQNSKFLDHYLDVPFDLSKVLFIATANNVNEIPLPLIDRMEVIELSGYALEEKLVMAEKWLIPKQLKKHGLKPSEAKFSSNVIRQVINDYAREPGVRTLEQSFAKICRKIVLKKVEKKEYSKNILESELENYLGLPIFQQEKTEKFLSPGIVTGMAWTPYGGDILKIECLPLKGKGFKLTGQLGEVMNESATLAYSYVKKILQDDMDREEIDLLKEKKLAELKSPKKTKDDKNKIITEKIKNESGSSSSTSENSKEEDDEPKDYLSDHEIHLHLPAGGIPKDGPSAGITIAVALYGLAHKMSIKATIAMTGELSLTGKVHPIGGLKEKVLAAKRAGIKEIIYPKQNYKDYKEIPKSYLKGLHFYPVEHINDVLKICFPTHHPLSKKLKLKKKV